MEPQTMTTMNRTREGVAPCPAGGAAPAPAADWPRQRDADRILLAADRTRERHAAILDLAAEGFSEQPSPNCVRAAARRLCAAIAALADEIAEGRAA
jgi:hypothetical protein